MRPVVRPVYTGTLYQNYGSYLKPLLKAFGRYCSYCERPEKLDVEHVVPKSHRPDLELEWTNLLLGCPRCNRDFKKNHNDSRDGYIWPDKDNTFALLHYLPSGAVKPATGLTQTEQARTQATIDLVKLDDGKLTQQPLNLARRQTFQMANRVKGRYQNQNATMEEICEMAVLGYWSVWMTVFADIPEVVDALQNMPEYPHTRPVRNL